MADQHQTDVSGQQPPPVLHRRSRAGTYALVPVGGALAIGMIVLISTLAPQPAADGTLALEATLDETTLRASWAPVVGAASYELRVYDAGGRLLRASAVDGQTLAVDVDVLELGGVPSASALDVAALDRVGQTLARSERLKVDR
ncbi:MAG: hypothetical protein AB7T31_14295 [Gemmatimonadales bacterium]